jgi:hypothetical protein
MIMLSQTNLYWRKNNHNVSYLTCTIESSCHAFERARVPLRCHANAGNNSQVISHNASGHGP